MRLIKDYKKAIEQLKLEDLLKSRFLNNGSRAKRSLKRLIQKVNQDCPYAKMQLKQYYKVLKYPEDKKINVRCGNLLILPHMIDKKINLYDGKTYKEIRLKEEMLGRFIGEFILTRTKGAHSSKGQSADKIKR